MLNFPRKTGKKDSKKLLRKIRETGGCDRRDGTKMFQKVACTRVNWTEPCYTTNPCKILLLKRYTDNEVDFMWFTDEKVFTVAILFVTIDVECIVLI